MADFMWGDESWCDVFNAKQSKIKHKKYILDNMTGIIDIGKVRDNNEDSLLLYSQGGAELMAVADGMGGMANGELASNYALLMLGIWFKKYNINAETSEKKIYEDLKEILKAVDEQIYYNFGESGTTLAMAIKLKDRTCCLNVGDSRIYTFNNNAVLEQVLHDQSPAYTRYELNYKEKIEKDYMRYMIGNNIVSSALGTGYHEETETIGNDDYNDLFLFTDGVTDIVSEKMLKDIITSTSPDEVDDKIIETALNHFEENYDLPEWYFRDEIIGGKDNATLAHLSKEKGKILEIKK